MKNAILAIALFSILTGIIYFFATNFVNKVSNNDSKLSLKINNKNYYLVKKSDFLSLLGQRVIPFR